MSEPFGKVYIAGAGPGDPGLLTLKAARAIEEADVILFDRLVNPEIMQLARLGCRFIDVGKSDGRHTMPQEEINQTLVRLAQRGLVVVRLKGGDPFVFGRGGEEAAILAQNGISFEVIPGVSSAVAAPAYAGIPVTSRGVASSVTIVAGHSCDQTRGETDWAALSGRDTLVFMMGVEQRGAIARNLISAGRPPTEPVAFIERGTTETQKTILSTLGEVAEGRVNVSSPAVFVVGEVVNQRDKIGWFHENAGV